VRAKRGPWPAFLLWTLVLGLGASWGIAQFLKGQDSTDALGPCDAFDAVSALTPTDNGCFFIQLLPVGRVLAYVRLAEPGKVVQVEGTLGIWTIHRLSPSQRYLAVTLRDEHGGARHETVRIVDVQRMEMVPIHPSCRPDEAANPFWCSDGRLLVDMKNAGKPGPRQRIEWEVGKQVRAVEQESGVLKTATLLSDRRYRLHHMSSDEVAIVSRDWDVSGVNLKTGRHEVLNRVTGIEASGAMWWNPSADGSGVLFCGSIGDEEFRRLYSSRVGEAVKPLSEGVQAYNGKWLGSSRGFGYIASKENRFFLSLNPDRKQPTNLFVDGWCRTFTPAPSGRQVWAQAAIGGEPCGVWVYSIDDCSLAKMVSVDPRGRSSTNWVRPFEQVMVTSSGRRAHVYRCQDPRVGKPGALVIGVPPHTDQVSRMYDPRAQILVNAGFDYIGVNYAGCDGYSSKLSQSYDVSSAATDVSEIIDRLLAEERYQDIPCIGVFQSASGDLAPTLVDKCRSQFAGIAFIRASADFDSSSRGRIRRTLAICGEEDDVFLKAMDMTQSLRRSRIPAEFVTLGRVGHLYVDSTVRRREESGLLKFVEACRNFNK